MLICVSYLFLMTLMSFLSSLWQILWSIIPRMFILLLLVSSFLLYCRQIVHTFITVIFNICLQLSKLALRFLLSDVSLPSGFKEIWSFCVEWHIYFRVCCCDGRGFNLSLMLFACRLLLRQWSQLLLLLWLFLSGTAYWLFAANHYI